MLRKQLPGAAVVVEVELTAAECKDSSQHKLCDAVTVLLGVRQAKRAAPGATEACHRSMPRCSRSRSISETKCQVVFALRSAPGSLAWGRLWPQPR